MAAHDDWNARVELGRRIKDALLKTPAVATDDEIEAALLKGVEESAYAVADLNELMYVGGHFLMQDSEVMQREARAVADYARARVAAYQWFQKRR